MTKYNEKLDIPTRFANLEKRLKRVEGSTVGPQTLVDKSDIRTLSAPQNLQIVSAVAFDETGGSYSKLTAVWDPVTEAVIGTDLEISVYELWARPNASGSLWRRLTAAPTTTAEYHPMQPGTSWKFKVRAIARASSAPGDWSEEVTSTMAGDTNAPDKPSTPVVSSRLGQVTVTWDGLTHTGEAQPSDFLRLEVAIGSSTNPTNVVGSLPGPGSLIVTGQPYNSSRYVRTRAVDKSGNYSTWSDNASISVQPLVDTDLIGEVINGANIQDGTITASEKIVGESITGAEIAAFTINAGHLNSNSVTADKIGLGAVGPDRLQFDLNDSVANPIWADSVFRGLYDVPVSSSWTFSTNPPDLPMEQTHVLRMPASASAFSMALNQRMNCAPGDKYYVRFVAKRDLDVDWKPYLDLSVMDANDNVLPTNTISADTSTLKLYNLAPNPTVEVDTTSYAGVASTISRDTTWASRSSASLRIIATGSSNDSYASVNGDGSNARLKLEAGKTYTISGDARISGVHSGTLHEHARKIVVRWKQNGTTVVGATSDQLPNVSGLKRLSVTFTVPENASEVSVRLYNGSGTANTSIWWDGINITPHWAILRENLVKDPRVASDMFSTFYTIKTGTPTISKTSEDSYYGETSVKVVTNAANQSFTTSTANLERGIEGRSYNVSAWVRATSGVSITLSAERVGYDGLTVSTASSTTVTATGQWQRITITNASLSTNYSWMRPVISAGSATTFYADGFCVEDSEWAAENGYFDGDTKPDNYSLSQYWTGEANKSSSIIGMIYIANEDYWSGLSTNASWMGTAHASESYLRDFVPASGVYTSFSGIITIPNGGITFQPTLYSTTGTAGVWYISMCTVKKVIKGVGYSGQGVEISPDGLTIWGPEDIGQPDIYMGTLGTPNITFRDIFDRPTFIADRNGNLTAKHINAQSSFFYRGTSLDDLILNNQRGILAKGEYQGSRITGITSEQGLFEIGFEFEEGRAYQINGAIRTFPSTVASELYARVRYTTNNTSPTLSSTAVLEFQLGRISADTWDIKFFEHTIMSNSFSGANNGDTIRLLLSVYKGTGTGTISVEPGYNTHLTIFDVGKATSTSGVINTGGGSASSPVKNYTKTRDPEWRMDYNSSNAVYNYNTSRLYVGKYGGFEWAKTLIGFPDAMRTDLAGAANVGSIHVYIDNDHFYSSSGGKVVIGRHDHNSQPTTASWYTDGLTESFSYGEGRYVRLPTSWYAGFVNGTHKGIAIYAPTTSLDYYGYYNRSTTGTVYYQYSK